MERELTPLLRVYLEGPDGPVTVTPTVIGGVQVRPKRHVFLARMPWEPEVAEEDFWLPFTGNPHTALSSLMRSVYKRFFGSAFFAESLISQGESLLEPNKLALWDKAIRQIRDHSADARGRRYRGGPAGAAR